ncbi:hypothetical protein COTS27_01124 [Spirochaetota bacterium]|nr:hypothetical protein COTS27_01124 [Spirochaetota bacterium]
MIQCLIKDNQSYTHEFNVGNGDCVKKIEEIIENEEADITTLDLRGVKCPLNFIKAKMHLAKLALGEKTLIVLDDGEPIDSVPASLISEGHEIVAEEMCDDGNAWKLLVKK